MSDREETKTDVLSGDQVRQLGEEASWQVGDTEEGARLRVAGSIKTRDSDVHIESIVSQNE